MNSNRETLLCQYQYDPLDRLIDCAISEQVSTERFYLKERLVTEIGGAVQRSIMQHEDQLLAERQRRNDSVEIQLLATDQKQSVLNVLNPIFPHQLAYTVYGHRPPQSGLPGFNGERQDSVTGHYLLGNGYRAFNPVLMRFNSPDSWSPFGEGGMNAYAYCSGDPQNRSDATGHMSIFPKGYNPVKGLKNRLRLRTPSHLKKETLAPGTVSAVGYHGTSERGAQSILASGLQEDFIGSNTTVASGFSVSKDLDVAQGYARDHLRKNHRAVVLKVYVKDIQKKKSGLDYFVGTGGQDGEIVLAPSMYNDVSFQRHGSLKSDNPGNYHQTHNQEIRSMTNSQYNN